MQDNAIRRVVLCAYDTNTGNVGGPIRWAQDLVTFLKDTGIHIHVLILQQGAEDKGPIASTCNHHNIPYQILDTGTTHYLEDQIIWIISQLRIIKADVLIANLVLPAMYAANFVRPYDITTVTVVHSDPSHDSYYSDVVQTLISSRKYHPDIVVSVSEFIDQIVSEHINDSNISRIVIPCGCAENQASASPPINEIRLIYAGRLVCEQKRIRETTESLLNACTRLGTRATICGDGPEKDWLKDRLKQQSSVTYTGLLSSTELAESLSHHHAFILLSDYEGTSIALTEAMSIGLVPICLEAINGITEIINSGQNGIIVADRSDSFIKAVESLNNPELWNKLSAGAKNTILNRYSHTITFEQWKSLILSCRTSRSDQIPLIRQVRVSRDQSVFIGYAPCKPNLCHRVMGRMKVAIQRLRIFIAPRRRLRQLLRITNITPRGKNT